MAVLVALLLVIVAAATRPAAAQPAAGPPGATGEGDGPPIRLTCVGAQAPATVHVALVIPPDPPTDPATSPLHVRYEWDFGDPAGRWNRLPGWNAAHVYDQPGRYTITLTATDAAGRQTRRTTWVRIAPDERRRIYVSGEGNDQAHGGTPAAAVRTAARAFAMAKDDTAILFRRGDVFDVSATVTVNARNVRVGPYDPAGPGPTGPGGGGGAARVPSVQPIVAPDAFPVLRKVEGPAKQPTTLFVGRGARDVLIEGIEFDSIWPLTGPLGPKKVPARAITAGGTNITVRDCSFRNVTDGMNTEMRPTGMLLQSSYFSPEIRGYCYWGNGADHVLVGNVMTHARQEHQIRCSEPGVVRLLVAYNDLSRPNNAKGGIELRQANWFTIAANHLDGGTMRIGPQDDGIDQAQSPDWPSVKCTWGVVQDNRFDRIGVHVRLGTEHVVLRNNAVRQDDGEWAFVVVCKKPGWDHVRRVVDVTIESNTAINQGTKGHFLSVLGKPDGLVVRNNLFVAPRLGSAGDKGGSIYTTEADLGGVERVEGNVFPAGEGGRHNAGPGYVARGEWTTRPQVRAERYQDVTVDPDDNPPPTVGAGARLGPDKREREAKRAAQGKPPPDYRPPGAR